MATTEEIIDALELVAAAGIAQTVATDAGTTAQLAQTAAYAATKTKVDTGLNNVDNTSDEDKPVSIAAQNLIDTKQVELVS
jgi:hypothetical protein